MADDEFFEPRLGRMRTRGGKRQRRFLHRILAAANLARGGAPGLGGRTGFTGSRIGRGAGAGRVLAASDRFAAFRARRVVVKSRIVRLAAKGMANARAHLRYLQRDGTTRQGEPGNLYGPEQDVADGRAFLARGSEDRHQFRVIVSPEDGDAYPDLKTVTRRLMAQMEEDLGTRLDWVAVDHFNTGHPHTHILLRGADDQGRDLVIARDYLTRGMRARAGEILDMDLGPPTDREIESRLRAEVGQARFTGIDRRLLSSAALDRVVSATAADPFEQSLRAGRLAKLERMGLAEPLAPGFWKLDSELEETLRTAGERGDILRTLQRAVAGHGLERGGADQSAFDPRTSPPLTGRILERGLSEELRDRHYLVVDGVDGRVHYVDIGRGDAELTLKPGMIVEIVAMRPTVREADRRIAAIAAAHGGRYSIDLHLRADPSATSSFAETHVRRLEAMRRAGIAIEREVDGRWRIAPDHLDQALAYEAQRAHDRPVNITPLSWRPLEKLDRYEGETWLDRRIAALDATVLRDAGFGAEVRTAEVRRRAWLVSQDLIRDPAAILPPDGTAALRRREMIRVAAQLSSELGLDFRETKAGEAIAGILDRRLALGSGREYGLIRMSKEFTLVPWRPGLERALGKSIVGRTSPSGINWSPGTRRDRSIG